MFKRRNRAWMAVLLAGALVAGLATQAFATPVAPDRPTGLTADLDSGGGGEYFLAGMPRTRRWTRGRCCARSVPRRQPTR